jgi:hypothetical protein
MIRTDGSSSYAPRRFLRRSILLLIVEVSKRLRKRLHSLCKLPAGNVRTGRHAGRNVRAPSANVGITVANGTAYMENGFLFLNGEDEA